MSLPSRPASEPVYWVGGGRWFCIFTARAQSVWADARRLCVGPCPSLALRRAARSRGWWACLGTRLDARWRTSLSHEPGREARTPLSPRRHASFARCERPRLSSGPRARLPPCRRQHPGRGRSRRDPSASAMAPGRPPVRRALRLLPPKLRAPCHHFLRSYVGCG